MKRSMVFLFVLLSLCNSAIGKGVGVISGMVKNKGTGELIRSATIRIKGTKWGSQSDVKGKFIIKGIPSDSLFTIRCSFVGYRTCEIDSILVTDGELKTLDILLEEQVSKTDEVIVEVRRSTESQSTILAQRKNAMGVTDGISKEEITKSSDGYAGQVLKRVSGVTLVGDKFIYVRGVSDRYNTTTLNGAALATTETDKRAFAFDMFPSEFLQSATVTKSFTPDLPGNFVGGLVQLNTIDFPDGFSVKVNISSAFNTNTTLQDKGFSIGGTPTGLPSSTPSSRKEMDKIIRDAYAGVEDAQNKLQGFGRDLKSTSWKQDSITANPNTSTNISYTNIFDVFDNELGVIGSVFYNNTFSIKTAGDRNTTLGDGSYERISSGKISNESINSGGMVNVAYKIGSNHSLSIKNIINKSFDLEVLNLSGTDSTQGIDFKQYSSQYLEKSLVSSQIGGEHTLPIQNILLDWRFGYSHSDRNEPDFRRLRYSRQSTSPDLPFIADIQPMGDGTLAGRFFSTLTDEIINGGLNITIPMSTTFKIKLGGITEMRDRGFSARSFAIASNDAAGLLGTDYYAGSPDVIFDSKNFDRVGDTLYMREDSKPSDGYTGTEALYAGYSMVDFGVGDFRIITGVRLEDNRIQLNGFYSNGIVANINYHTFDVLPALNLIYKLGDNTNIRSSASQTLTRPTFRELAPFEFYNFNDLVVVRGNTGLQRTLVQNYDLRFETFMSSNEVFSIGGFFKSFVNPIEETLSGETGGKPDRTWQNSNGVATNWGAEIELRKTIGDFLFSTNVSLVNSQITVSQGNNTETRTMWGQSPYSVNCGLYYTNVDLGTSVNVSYNRVGRRIVSVAQLGRFPDLEVDGSSPHWYEEPRDLVDITITQNILSGFDCKITVKDILNQALYWKQGDRIVQSNVFGTTASISLSYKLF